MTKDQANQMVNEDHHDEEEQEVAQGASENEEPAEQSGALDPVEALQKELADMKDQWLRSVAELENQRKRAERDQAEMRKYAVTEFARDLTTVCENLHRALDSTTPEILDSEESKVLKTLHSGVDMTRSELLKAFERHGIKRIHPERGDAFDHNVHQAVSQVEDASVADGSISQVIQAGYSIHDRLLAPAMVAVAKSATDAKPTVDTSA